MSECISKLNGLLITSELGVKPVFRWPNDVGVAGKTVSSSLRCDVMDELLVAAVRFKVTSHLLQTCVCFLYVYTMSNAHHVKSVIFRYCAVASSCSTFRSWCNG